MIARFKNIIWLGLVLFMSCHKQSTPIQPNILLIHADQHRMDCLGAYGNPDILTPHLDQLAEDGVIYHNSYCPLPVCTPSRYSLLSGMYVHEHQGWTNHSTLHPDIETFPDLLQKAGYRTKSIGKMHFAPTYLDVGFHEMILAEQDGPGRWDDDYHRDLMNHGLVDAIDLIDQRSEYRQNASEEYWRSFGTKSTNLPDTFYSTDWIARHARNALDDWRESGNLLMVGFIKPHHPFDPPQKWADQYDPDQLELLPGWIARTLRHDTSQHKGYFPNVTLNETALRKSMAYYYASITQIDYEVGRMIRILKDKKLYDNTLIIYTSDHGEHLGYHHQILKGGNLYESIMKVPLIIKYPQKQFAGTENHDLVSNVDLAPTILKVVNITPPPAMSGLDLREDIPRTYVFAHAWLGNQAMARSKQNKLILSQHGQSLFYDLENDPLELNNLYTDSRYTGIIEKHYQAILQWQGMDTLNAENYLDESAPIISGPNVTQSGDGHRDEIINYYKAKMEEFWISEE